MNFGWLKDTSEYETSLLKISTLTCYEKSIIEVESSAWQDGKWYYQPIVNNRLVSRFELPLTHEISHKSKSINNNFLEFMLFYYGWLNGQRLNPEGWGHLIKASVNKGLAVDFLVFNKTMSKLLELGEDFWHKYQAQNELIVLMASAFHWYLFSRSYERYFERFIAQYMVLDTLYKIASLQLNKKEKTHKFRIEFLAKELNLCCPSWGVVNDGDSIVSVIRNKLIHEGALAGSPIGFSYDNFPMDILVQLEAFNCRLIASLIGAQGQYSRSSCETMQYHAFEVD